MSEEQDHEVTDTEPTKNPWYKRWWSITGIALMIIIAFGLALGLGDDSANREPTEASRNSSEVEPAKSNEHFTNQDFAEVLGDADAHRGATVDITGKVFVEPKKQDGVWQLQIHTNPKNSEGNTIVIGQADFEVKLNDFIHVVGTVEKSLAYKNAMNAEMSAPLIMSEPRSDAIQKVPAQDVVAPTENSVAVNQAQDQHGVVVSFTHVEFAADETRLYVTVKNNGSQKARVYSHSMKVTQGSAQYEPQSSYGNGYPELQSEILPGIETSGIVVFPKLDFNSKTLTLHVEGSSENYSLRFAPYVFGVSW